VPLNRSTRLGNEDAHAHAHGYEDGDMHEYDESKLPLQADN
jgi:hypothetical protein